MEPDLVSIAGGVNDLLRPKWDVGVSGEILEEESSLPAMRAPMSVVRLWELVATIARDGNCHGPPSGVSGDHASASRRARVLRRGLLAETVFDDSRFWAEDRLHLNELRT